MPQSFKKTHIKLLLDRLADKTNQSLEYYGLGQISDAMEGSVSQKYLYDSLYRPTRDIESENETLNLAPNKIDEIARFLGYDSFNSFINEEEVPLSPVLKYLKGSYYSYVRKNAEDGILFQSPVKIEKEGLAMSLTLKGPHRDYIGKLELQDGCMFCLMKANDKSFYHIYQVGKVKSPKVLQGVFSGITSGNLPIGGRCVLIKQDEKFEDLSNQELLINEMAQSESNQYQKLAKYFEDHNENNLMGGKSVGFDLDDLG